ncbi:hypothetical protein LFT44_02980 [Arthrobacter sp. FW306-05-C]|uniref:hypothetical protein n=1 Tax=Arthrobacter TaxID=1663 RepID=UPI001EF002CC|nr:MULTISPECIES: hypothetical protein [Arthrobacter]MDP9986186.1 hypothetical protein [Arthrobacter oryzae]UKA67412.1 hypothetical protein LFT44_02980 [Arthrobacter sp. FW306-05-C]UKA71881.1 hypothetical protein LFT49_03815 [Arthrobacter sp. FW306-06-A]UKA76047.1 hypothetical protein LFT46_02965 [Arthrobacter sp. FW306-07-I]
MNRTKMGLLSVASAAALAVGLAPGTALAHGGSGHGNPDHSDDWRSNDDQRRLVRTLRHVTDDYRWLENAEADGYRKITECIDKSGVGAMGFHYAKQELIDDKTQARKPEVLVYMPDEDGRYELVAAEFLSTAAERPELAGLDFEDGPFPGSYALHAWIWRDNPDGMFASYNPDLTCPK